MKRGARGGFVHFSECGCRACSEKLDDKFWTIMEGAWNHSELDDLIEKNVTSVLLDRIAQYSAKEA